MVDSWVHERAGQAFPFWESIGELASLSRAVTQSSITIVLKFDYLVPERHTMTHRLLLAVVFFALIVATCSLLHAESSDCSAPVLIIPDGRLTQSSFTQNSTFWYGIYAVAGHSYAVEFEPPADNYSGASHAMFLPLAVYGPNDALAGCRGTSSVQVTTNSGSAPTILKNGYGAGRRVSFTAATPGLYLVAVTTSGLAGNYTFRAVDTTLVNVDWSTGGGFDNEWMFHNVSDMPITGVLTVYDFGNNVVSTAGTYIPPGSGVMRYSYSFDLNLPRNRTGNAVFSHNGPPNSIMAISYTVNAAFTVLTPVRMDPVAPQ